MIVELSLMSCPCIILVFFLLPRELAAEHAVLVTLISTGWSADWGPKIDVVGFCFLDLASNYEPPEELVKWLEDGEKPIYIGFGSLVS